MPAWLLALCLFLIPAPATALDQSQAEWLAHWVGVPEGVVHVVAASDPDEYNGVFTPGGPYCDPFSLLCPEWATEIVLFQGANVPDDIMTYTLLHEIGHYLQWQSDPLGFLMRSMGNIVSVEQAADAMSVWLMCQRGMDGERAIAHAFQWAADKLAYTGDVTHGSAEDRVAYAITHAHCPPITV